MLFRISDLSYISEVAKFKLLFSLAPLTEHRPIALFPISEYRLLVAVFV